MLFNEASILREAQHHRANIAERAYKNADSVDNRDSLVQSRNTAETPYVPRQEDWEFWADLRGKLCPLETRKRRGGWEWEGKGGSREKQKI